jgi:hypothetical protein
MDNCSPSSNSMPTHKQHKRADLRVLLISSTQIELLKHPTIREYLDATPQNRAPVHGWDPDRQAGNWIHQIQNLQTPGQDTYRVSRYENPMISAPAHVTLRWLTAHKQSVLIVFEDECGGEMFQYAAKTICDGDFWRQSMSRIVYRKKGESKPSDDQSDLIRLEHGYPEIIQEPKKTYHELLQMELLQILKHQNHTDRNAQRWGLPTIDLSKGMLWYLPAYSADMRYITRSGWQNLPELAQPKHDFVSRILTF